MYAIISNTLQKPIIHFIYKLWFTCIFNQILRVRSVKKSNSIIFDNLSEI